MTTPTSSAEKIIITCPECGSTCTSFSAPDGPDDFITMYRCEKTGQVFDGCDVGVTYIGAGGYNDPDYQLGGPEQTHYL